MKSASVWQRRKTLVPNPIPLKNWALNFEWSSLIPDVYVLNGTNFLAWTKLLITPWLPNTKAIFGTFHLLHQGLPMTFGKCLHRGWVASTSVRISGWLWTNTGIWNTLAIVREYMRCITRDKAVFCRFLQADRELSIFSKSNSPIMSKDICWGSQMKAGTSSSILGAVRSIFCSLSSGICNIRTLSDCHRTPSGGLIGGELGSPPSNTIILESICLHVNVNWFGGTVTSRNSWTDYCCFFLARLHLRWRTLGDFTNMYAVEAHCVRREVVEVDLENTWTHVGSKEGGLITTDGTSSTSSNNLSSMWQLNPDDTEDCLKGLQWTLSVMTFTRGDRLWLSVGFIFIRDNGTIAWWWAFKTDIPITWWFW